MSETMDGHMGTAKGEMVQSSPGQWDTEMLLALGFIFEHVLPKLAWYIMFVTFIATYL